jgi:hypothetical protein
VIAAIVIAGLLVTDLKELNAPFAARRAAVFGSCKPMSTLAGMDDLTYCTGKPRQPEQDLDAAQ